MVNDVHRRARHVRLDDGGLGDHGAEQLRLRRRRRRDQRQHGEHDRRGGGRRPTTARRRCCRPRRLSPAERTRSSSRSSTKVTTSSTRRSSSTRSCWARPAPAAASPGRPPFRWTRWSTFTVGPGEEVTYTITIANEGASAVALSSITDTLPAGFTYVAGSTTESRRPTPRSRADADLEWVVPGSGQRQHHARLLGHRLVDARHVLQQRQRGRGHDWCLGDADRTNGSGDGRCGGDGEHRGREADEPPASRRASRSRRATARPSSSQTASRTTREL